MFLKLTITFALTFLDQKYCNFIVSVIKQRGGIFFYDFRKGAFSCNLVHLEV